MAAPGSKFTGLRRKSFSPWVRYPSLVLLYGVLVPLAKLFEITRIGRLMSGRRRRIRLRDFGDYTATAHDVIACVYFKSGTNWLMQILVQMIHRGKAEFEHIHDLVPWPDSPDPRYAVPLSDETAWKQSPSALRVIKTHLPFDKVPYSPEAHYICVVRDPKDVCVSGYHFMRAEGMGPMTPSIANFVEDFISPNFFFHSWPEFVAGCWRVRDRENVLFLTYEEMKKDLPGAVCKIASLLKIPLSDDEIAQVVRQSSFEHMKTIEHKFETGMIVPWAKPQGAMIRRGQHKSSGELLTPELQNKIDDHCRAELKRLGCDFPYDQIFG